MPRKSTGERANSQRGEQACKDQQTQRGGPTHKTKSKHTGTDTKRNKHVVRREEKHRNRLEKQSKTGEPQEKSRHTIRRAGSVGTDEFRKESPHTWGRVAVSQGRH